MRQVAWQDQARCKGLSYEESEKLFFLKQGGSPVKGKEFCSQCPVRQECFNEAILYSEQGIWGATIDEERAFAAPVLKPILQEQARASRQLKEFSPPTARPETLTDSTQCQCGQDCECDTYLSNKPQPSNWWQTENGIPCNEPHESDLDSLGTDLMNRLPA